MSRLIYVIPRVQLASRVYGQTEFSLGKATILPDVDATWSSRIQKPRPSCLDTFHNFPYDDQDPDLPVARGTILVSDDESWLRANVSYVVSVAYVLGIQENYWQPPSEAFQYYDISVGDIQHELVQFHTKTSSILEDTSSFKLLPPLELRSPRDRFRIDPRSDVFVELIKRLEETEPDRLIVSCFHLFRTQFANAFLAPPAKTSPPTVHALKLLSTLSKAKMEVRLWQSTSKSSTWDMGDLEHSFEGFTRSDLYSTTGFRREYLIPIGSQCFKRSGRHLVDGTCCGISVWM